MSKSSYSEDFFGIRYSATRNEDLTITADPENYSLNCWDGVLNLMSKDCCGRTALFMKDCDFFTGKKITIKVKLGTPSYAKELNKVRKVSTEEYKQWNLGKLW